MKMNYIAPELTSVNLLSFQICATSADASYNDVSIEGLTVGEEIDFD